jgi:predicted metal-dependent peptidase
MGDEVVKEEVKEITQASVIKPLHDKLMKTSIIFSSFFPFYAEFMLSFNIYEKEDIMTAGTNTSMKGMNLYYAPSFVDKLTQEESNFLMMHEINHQIFNHIERGKSYDRNISNIAMDMIINSLIVKEIESKYMTPINNDIAKALFVPLEYKDVWVFEKLYEWLNNTKPNYGKNGKQKQDKGEGKDKQQGNGSGQGQQQKQQQGQGGSGGEDEQEGQGEEDGNNSGGFCKDTNKILEDIDQYKKGKKKIKEYLDKHMEDEVPQDMKESIVNDVIERCRQRGLVAGAFEKILDGLRKPSKDYLKEIKRNICNMVGGKKKRTWMRPNRKELPIKGYKKQRVGINT